MNCTACKNILPLLAMGETTDDEKTAALTHIESCPACRGEYRELQRIVQALSQPAAENENDSAKLRLENRVLSELVARSRRPTVPTWHTLLRLAAVLIIFILGYAARPAIVSVMQEQPPSARVEATPPAYASSLSPGMRFSAAGLKVIARGKTAAPEMPQDKTEPAVP